MSTQDQTMSTGESQRGSAHNAHHPEKTLRDFAPMLKKHISPPPLPLTNYPCHLPLYSNAACTVSSEPRPTSYSKPDTALASLEDLEQVGPMIGPQRNVD